jgi:hypothetical protein
LGLAGIGFGILFIRLAIYSTKGFMWIARFVGRKINGRGGRYGRAATI